MKSIEDHCAWYEHSCQLVPTRFEVQFCRSASGGLWLLSTNRHIPKNGKWLPTLVDQLFSTRSRWRLVCRSSPPHPICCDPVIKHSFGPDLSIHWTYAKSQKSRSVAFKVVWFRLYELPRVFPNQTSKPRSESWKATGTEEIQQKELLMITQYQYSFICPCSMKHLKANCIKGHFLGLNLANQSTQRHQVLINSMF